MALGRGSKGTLILIPLMPSILFDRSDAPEPFGPKLGSLDVRKLRLSPLDHRPGITVCLGCVHQLFDRYRLPGKRFEEEAGRLRYLALPACALQQLFRRSNQRCAPKDPLRGEIIPAQRLSQQPVFDPAVARASAANASEPVTRSTGFFPSVPFVKWVMPMSAAPAWSAKSTNG